MKLAKLSLAAIVAAGALTTVNAKPLEEAIKGVELTGFFRYRFYSEDGARDAVGDRHRFSAPFAFSAPIADNIKAGLTIRYEDSDYAANGDVANGATATDVTKMWFMYSGKDFTVKAGKFEILSPWTDSGYAGDRGNGMLAMYTGVPGWAFAGAAFVDSNNAIALDENIYAVAAIGSMGPVNAQVWAVTTTNIVDHAVFAQVDTKFAGVSLKGQLNMLTLADEMVAPGAEDTGIIYAVEAGYGINGFNMSAGYIDNDDDQGIHTFNADDTGIIKAGKQLYYETTNVAGAETILATLGYGMGDYSLEAGYADAEVKGADFGDEWYVQAKYKYSKNLAFTTYYSDMDMEVDAADNKQLRFEAKYSF